MLSKRSSWPSQRAPASPAQSCAASASLLPPELFIIALPVSYQSKSAHDAEGGERPIDMAAHETGAEDGALDKSQPPPIALYTATSCTAVVACARTRSEEHTSELQSLMRISYAVFCLKKKKNDTSNIAVK